MNHVGPDEARPQSTGLDRLAAELRLVRDLAGVSGRTLAGRIKLSQATVSRIESGARLPTAPEVRAWAEALSAPAETRERLIALMEAAYTEIHPYRTALQRRRSGHLQDDVHDQEALARQVRVFQASLVPGLLQTAGYAKRVFQLFPIPYSDEDLAAAVATRLDRQLALYEAGRSFEFLITEAALRWRPGPINMLLAQLARIDSLSTLENVAIGLIPANREALTSIGHGFAMFDDNENEQDGYVTVETVHADLSVRKPEDVDLYRKRWMLLSQMAVFGDEARQLLSDLVVDIRMNAK